MARTKASVGSKISSGKSSKARCTVAAPPAAAVASGSSDRGSRGGSSGNPVCHRETPKWQKPITNFFICKDGEINKDNSVEEYEVSESSSKPKPKRNIIQSDDEESPEKPKNKVLDESLTLEPLTGEDSHKIVEYYPKNGVKGKGVGKKTKGKENISFNAERNSKRDRDDEVEDELSDSEQISKKIKVH